MADQITTTIGTISGVPDRDDPDNFNTQSDDFFEDLPGAIVDINAVAGEMNTLATSVEADAAAAETAKDLAVAAGLSATAAANATIYAGGTTYAAGAIVLDPNDNYKFYTSQQGSNTGNTPNSDNGDYWLPTIITPRVITKTGTASLTASELSGLATINNNGAVAQIVLTWLTLVNAQEATFYVNDAQYLQIKAPTGKTIRLGSDESGSAGYIRSNTVGNWVHIKAMPDGLVVFGSGGNWLMDE
ncbi:MAG: hypothetical protein HOE02_05675 [Candidatus Marinimicrobia bacterium]|jgi:hypothetical protein|nr:hypothetical protein [Candidatus Neomarinimicrobiota bacterium]